MRTMGSEDSVIVYGKLCVCGLLCKYLQANDKAHYRKYYSPGVHFGQLGGRIHKPTPLSTVNSK